MVKKLYCLNTGCESNSRCGIDGKDLGLCEFDGVTIGKSGFCLGCSTVDKSTIDKLEEDAADDGMTLEAQDEEL